MRAGKKRVKMLLRRLMQHINQQNWFAVFLDFFIVVFGIWLAFQISEWADDLDRRAELDEQLVALSDDLSENIGRLLEHEQYTAGKLTDIDELRSILSGSKAEADMQRLDFLMADVFSVLKFQVQIAAYETLLSSGNLLYLNGTHVRSELNAWQEDLALLKEGETVLMNVRDQVLLPYAIQEYSFAAAIEQTDHVRAGMQKSRFRNDFDSLQRSRKIDNMQAVQLATRSTVHRRIGKLLESTRAAKTAIDDFLKHH